MRGVGNETDYTSVRLNGQIVIGIRLLLLGQGLLYWPIVATGGLAYSKKYDTFVVYLRARYMDAPAILDQ